VPAVELYEEYVKIDYLIYQEHFESLKWWVVTVLCRRILSHLVFQQQQLCSMCGLFENWFIRAYARMCIMNNKLSLRSTLFSRNPIDCIKFHSSFKRHSSCFTRSKYYREPCSVGSTCVDDIDIAIKLQLLTKTFPTPRMNHTKNRWKLRKRP
jgi:hypothetical protein